MIRPCKPKGIERELWSMTESLGNMLIKLCGPQHAQFAHGVYTSRKTDPDGVPKGSQIDQKGAQRKPREGKQMIHLEPNVSQWGTKGSQKGARGNQKRTQRKPKESQREAKWIQWEPKKAKGIQKSATGNQK